MELTLPHRKLLTLPISFLFATGSSLIPPSYQEDNHNHFLNDLPVPGLSLHPYLRWMNDSPFRINPCQVSPLTSSFHGGEPTSLARLQHEAFPGLCTPNSSAHTLFSLCPCPTKCHCQNKPHSIALVLAEPSVTNPCLSLSTEINEASLCQDAFLESWAKGGDGPRGTTAAFSRLYPPPGALSCCITVFLFFFFLHRSSLRTECAFHVRVQSPAQREMRQEGKNKSQAVTVTCYTDGGICCLFFSSCFLYSPGCGFFHYFYTFLKLSAFS